MKTRCTLKSVSTWFNCFICAIAVMVSNGCENINNNTTDSIDSELLNSDELEEYIIAGLELRQSIASFRNELKKNDFSKLEFIENAEGKIVMHIPNISTQIESKLYNFNEKKESLIVNYPQFASFSKKTKSNYFRDCISNSVEIASRSLELGIKIFEPKTRFQTETGGATIYLIEKNGCYYFPEGGSESPVHIVAHTHKNGQDPSPTDIANKPDNGGYVTATYYKGELNYY